MAKETDEKKYSREQLRERMTCVIIATYNNEKTLEDVVRGCMEWCDDVIVVNDGSTDRTSEILKRIEGITKIEYVKNKGKGYALKKGFKKAQEMGMAYAITLDSDGQHKPDDIKTMMQASKKHPGSLILGARKMDGIERTKGSGFANKFSNFWYWVHTGRKVPDTQTGYRLYPLKKMGWLWMITNRYESETEMIVLASWHGTKIESTYIDVYYPKKEERITHFRPRKDFARISAANTILCGMAIIYGLPLRLWRNTQTFLITLYAILYFLFYTMVIFTPMMWIYTKIEKDKEKQTWRIHKLMHWAARWLMTKHGIPGVKFTHYEDEGATFDNQKIVICNHQSHLDLMCQMIYSPKLTFMIKDWVWNNPTYGFLIRHAEYISTSQKTDEFMQKISDMAKRGYSIAIFPEGTRSTDCEIGRFHKGAFHIAEQLNLPIQMQFLYGAGYVLKKGTYHMNKGRIHIETDKDISQEELRQMGNITEQTHKIHAIYKERYSKIKNRLDQDA